MLFCAVELYAYTTISENKRLETSVIIYYDKSGSAIWPAGTETAVANAMNAWNSCGMKFAINNGFDCHGCSSGLVSKNFIVFTDGTRWADDPSQTSVTVITFDGLTPEYILIYLNANLKWSTKSTPGSDEYDVQSVITHELGHAIGLDHSSAGSAMNGPYQPGTVSMRTLNQDDINGAISLYGSTSFTTTTTAPPTATTTIITATTINTGTSTTSGGGGGGGGGDGTESTTTTVSGTTSTNPQSSTTTTVLDNATTTSIQESTTTTSEADNSLCPFIKVLGEARQAELNVLRQFRDNTLAKSSEGVTLITLYYAHCRELTDILSTHPALIKKAQTCILEVIPILRPDALKNGYISLNKNQVQTICRLLNDIQQKSSPDLRKSINIVLNLFESDERLSMLRIKFLRD